MKMTKHFAFLYLAALLVISGCDPQGCNQWKQIAGQLKDTDGDGWLDTNKNEKIDLLIESIDVPVQSQFHQLSTKGNDEMVLHRCKHCATLNNPAGPVATSRCGAQWCS